MLDINSLYIHFPFCRHLCNYCDFFKSVPQDFANDIQNFESNFLKMYDFHINFLNQNNYQLAQLETLYIGGGTPSLWGESGANFFKSLQAKQKIQLKENCEFTLEVNPGSWDDKSLNLFREVGVNRYSLGIQTLNENLLKYLDRVHSISDVHETLAYFNNRKFNFSVDFMLGLPNSEKFNRNVLNELEEILKYQPTHISLYILTTKSNYIYNKDLPREEWIENEFLTVSEYLRFHGFLHYEVSNFAKPGFESKHNLAYWRSKSTGAIGPSATGLLVEQKKRFKWKPHAIDIEIEDLSESELHLEKIYLLLRTNLGFNFQEMSSEKLEEVITDWQQKKLCDISNRTHVTLTPKGYLQMDSLMNDLFKWKIIK